MKVLSALMENIIVKKGGYIDGLMFSEPVRNLWHWSSSMTVTFERKWKHKI